MTDSNESRPLTVRKLPPAGPAGAAPPAPGVRRFADVLPLARTRPPQTPDRPGPGPAAGPPTGPGVGELREERRHIERIARVVGQAAFESMAGLRPVHQLARWLDPASFEKLQERVELTTAAHPAGTSRLYRNTAIRRTRVCRVAASTYEVSLVVADQTRVRAAALRIERRRGQWKVCAVEIG
ncbi:Rv3235 family protein [Arthrobacter halodurans]|uniref:Rv3235 family protein n=1 Tax=Arthrobacter halodurans TaxID=516699 RepID=A0ABV4UKX6_9MICC